MGEREEPEMEADGENVVNGKKDVEEEEENDEGGETVFNEESKSNGKVDGEEDLDEDATEMTNQGRRVVEADDRKDDADATENDNENDEDTRGSVDEDIMRKIAAAKQREA